MHLVKGALSEQAGETFVVSELSGAGPVLGRVVQCSKCIAALIPN